MRSILASIIIGGIVASAASDATPTNLSCGVQSTELCANYQTAQQPCETEYESDYSITYCNQATYFAWPNITSWEQCQSTCASSSDCESFWFYFYMPEGEEGGEYGGGNACVLFNHTVASYTTDCPSLKTQDEIYPLAQFYDVDCPQPALLTVAADTVPAHPSSDPVNGTCNSYRVFNGNQTQWAHINIGATAINQTQAQCASACQEQAGCASYYFGNLTEGYYDPALSTDQEYWPTQGPNGFQPAQCLLLSQPVESYTVAPEPDQNYVDQFYDLNCPTS